MPPFPFARLAAAVLALSAFFTMTGLSPASAAVTQTASCVDGGGVRWKAKAIWGSSYTANGVRRVSMNYAGWTTARAGTVPTDSSVSTYDGAGRRIQRLSWTGRFSYRSGAAYKVRNPMNPPSSPGHTKVLVSLGLDGDGRGNCTMRFTQPTATSTVTASDRYESDVVTGTNRERTGRGLAPLAAVSCVDSFAESQSKKMAAENRMYHQDLGPILKTCNLLAVGENVAYGYPDGTALVAAWMASPDHRANILNPRYRLIGVGATQSSTGRWYVAQVFGSQT